jgi:hypothetical protein
VLVPLFCFLSGCHQGCVHRNAKADDETTSSVPLSKLVTPSVPFQLTTPVVIPPCPVKGPNCVCGCLAGKPCNCTDTDYLSVKEWSEANPNRFVAVYVNREPEPRDDYAEKRCRHDAGWPHLKAQGFFYGYFRKNGFEAYGTLHYAPTRNDRVAKDFDPQEAAYYKLLDKLHPGDIFDVYVGQSVPSNAKIPSVRWDRYPDAHGRGIVRGYIWSDGNPYDGPEPVKESLRPIFRFWAPPVNCST